MSGNGSNSLIYASTLLLTIISGEHENILRYPQTTAHLKMPEEDSIAPLALAVQGSHLEKEMRQEKYIVK